MSLELPTANSREPASSQRKAGEAGSDRRKAWRSGLLPVLAHEEHDREHAQQPRHHGDGEDPAQRDVRLHQRESDQRSDHRAEGVHAAVQAERQPLLLGPACSPR